MAITKKGKLKEQLQLQSMMGNEAASGQLKAKAVAKIQSLPPDDPRIVEVLYRLQDQQAEIPLWLKSIVGLTGIGQAIMLFLGFIF